MNVSRSALLPFSARQIYQIIADVRSYPLFLNWCDGTDVMSESESEMIAKLFISYGKLTFGFSTRNDMIVDQSVSMNLVDGPFSSLDGKWEIKSLGDSACKVSLKMDFKFESTMTQRLFGGVFKSVISAQLDAFQKRAHDLHGQT